METIRECELCGDNTYVTLVQANDYLVTGETFNISRCLRCDFVFTNPRPSQNIIGKYYQSQQYISHTNSQQSTFEKVYQMVRQFMLQRKIALLKSLIPEPSTKIKLLDYGCATGEFLNVAAHHGFDVVGYEPDKNAREQATTKGLFVIEDIANLDLPKETGSYDVITLWHVLEHIPDLNNQIRRFSKLLKGNGLIIVAVPEYRSFDAKYYGSDWAAWDVPRHLNHFEEKTLCSLFSKYDFNYVKKKPLLFDSFYVSLLSEKTKKSGFKGLLRAGAVGLISNIKYTMGKNPCSSQIYIFKKGNL